MSSNQGASAFDASAAKLPADYFRSEPEKDIARVAFAAGVTVGALGVVADTTREGRGDFAAEFTRAEFTAVTRLLEEAEARIAQLERVRAAAEDLALHLSGVYDSQGQAESTWLDVEKARKALDTALTENEQ